MNDDASSTWGDGGPTPSPLPFLDDPILVEMAERSPYAWPDPKAGSTWTDRQADVALRALLAARRQHEREAKCIGQEMKLLTARLSVLTERHARAEEWLLNGLRSWLSEHPPEDDKQHVDLPAGRVGLRAQAGAPGGFSIYARERG